MKAEAQRSVSAGYGYCCLKDSMAGAVFSMSVLLRIVMKGLAAVAGL